MDAWVGGAYRNGLVTNAILVITVVFFVYVGAAVIFETTSKLLTANY